MDDQFQKRKATRLKTYDYNSIGSYFMTFCTKGRATILSQIVDGPRVVLSDVGMIVEKNIVKLKNSNKNISVDHFVIMPDHVHILLSVCKPNGNTTVQHSPVSVFISALKSLCNKEIGENIWQRGSFDHVIRDREDYDEHIRYIEENPMRWFYRLPDPLYDDEFFN